jgi:adenosine deaminase
MRQAQGFRTCVHAGRKARPTTLDRCGGLGVDRVDRGIAALDDPSLVVRLVREQTLLTVCPMFKCASASARMTPPTSEARSWTTSSPSASRPGSPS